MKFVSICLPVLVLTSCHAFAGEWANCNRGPTGAKADFSVPCRLETPISAEDSEIRFGRGSSELSAEAERTLDRQASELKPFPDLYIDIIGHVDRTEAIDAEGLMLGYRRALVVRDALIRRGISPDRISTDSHGDREIIPKSDDEAASFAMRFARTQTRQP